MKRAEALRIGQSRKQVLRALGTPTTDSAKRRFDLSTAHWDEPGLRQLAAIANFVRDVSGHAQIGSDWGVTVHFDSSERAYKIVRRGNVD
jgi:hypothetical protein